jgi:DnaJ-class molecular chaperone
MIFFFFILFKVVCINCRVTGSAIRSKCHKSNVERRIEFELRTDLNTFGGLRNE